MYISVAPFLKTLGNYTSHSNLFGHHDACDMTPNSPSTSKEIVPRTSEIPHMKTQIPQTVNMVFTCDLAMFSRVSSRLVIGLMSLSKHMLYTDPQYAAPPMYLKTPL